MRKPVFYTAGVIFLASLLLGCDALDSTMDTMSKNTYEEMGWASSDTSAADEVVKVVSNLKSFSVYDLSDDSDITAIAELFGTNDETVTEIYNTLKEVLDDEETQNFLTSRSLTQLCLPVPTESSDDVSYLNEALAKALANDKAKEKLTDALSASITDTTSAVKVTSTFALIDLLVETLTDTEVMDMMGLSGTVREVYVTIVDSLYVDMDALDAPTLGDMLVLQMATDAVTTATQNFLKYMFDVEGAPSILATCEDLLAGVQNIQHASSVVGGCTKGFFEFDFAEQANKLME